MKRQKEPSAWEVPLLLAVSLCSASPLAAQVYGVRTLAGSATGGLGSADGVGDAAQFALPGALAVDARGVVYVADSSNYTIRKVLPDGTVTTLAGLAGQWGHADGVGSSARFATPQGIAVDAAGVVYVADTYSYAIRQVLPDGTVTTLAGLADHPGSADGLGSAARFDRPMGVAVDAAGVMYVADYGNNTIRQVLPNGMVTTLAGLAGNFGSSDGVGSAARFSRPQSVAVDGAGAVYVADQGNNTIRKIQADGMVTTLAGLAGHAESADGLGSAARFDFPSGVAVNAAGVVYVADTDNYTIREIHPDGTVTTLAGLAGISDSTDGVGRGARFREPLGVAVDADGIIYVADDSIRRVQPNGSVTTLAGSPWPSGSADGIGSSARFYWPQGVAVDADGIVHVVDSGNETIRRIQPDGRVTTLAGLAHVPGSADGLRSAARFNGPSGLAVDAAGILYVADAGNNTIRKVLPDGTVTTLAGLAGITGSADGVGSAARFDSPLGVCVDATGVVYVADTHNQTIRTIQPDGTVATLAGLAQNPGHADGVGSAARFSRPQSVAVDGAGAVYVAEYSAIRKVQPNGTVTTLVGPSGGLGSGLTGITVDAAGVLYVVGLLTVSQVLPNGTNSTIAGSWEDFDNDEGCQFKSADGPGESARFCLPEGIATASPGRLVVADTDHNTIRVLTRLRGREFDGDAVTDVSVYRPSTGQWFARQSLSGPSTVRFGGGSDLPVSGDFDGDGLRDVAVYRPVFGTWFWLTSSTGNKQYAYLGWGVPGQNDLPAPGDYDGDGKADPTVFRPAYGTWFVLQSSTNYHSVMMRGWGIAGDVLVPGDYDGDGSTDIAVYRPSTGQWLVLPSSNGFTAGLPVLTVGDAGDVSVNGDFDGDGKKDIALYRPSNGTWYWAKSSSGNKAFESVGWGMQDNGDVPVPGDYDGDGKADPTVYRPASGTWFILKSSTNYTKFVA